MPSFEDTFTGRGLQPAIAVKVDDVYDDPNAEIIFISLDKVQFRVHKHLIQRCCDSVPLDRLPQVNHHPVLATVLRTFISLVYCVSLDLTPSLSCPFTHHNILTLVGQASSLKLGTVEAAIMRCVKDRAREDPWVVLSVASQREDLQLAKLALRSMGDDDWKRMEKYDEMDYEIFEHITKPYLFELLRLRGSCVFKVAPVNQNPIFGTSSRPDTPPVSASTSTFGVLSRSTATSAFTFSASSAATASNTSQPAAATGVIKHERDAGGSNQTRRSALYWEDIANRFAPGTKAEKRKRVDESGGAEVGNGT